VHDEIKPAEVLFDSGEYRRNVFIGPDVARQHERRLRESLRQFVDVLFEATLIRERKARSPARCRLCDGPRQRSFVGDANDEAELASEVGHEERGNL
jgi:hypothetical protein